jgi:hypothetical protein
VQLAVPVVTATGIARATVTGTPGASVELLGYTRPATEFRVVRNLVLDSNGRVEVELRPPGNTRLYAQQQGCAPGPQVVLDVRPALTLSAVRNGTRDYTFAGDSLPARPEGLLVSLYRVTPDGGQVLTAQARADASGRWRIRRSFSGAGRFGFVVRTGRDLQNAAGASSTRPTLVY